MYNNSTTSINLKFQHFTKNRDVVFFLGAGFSADLGLPVMKDFQSASEIEYKFLSKENPSIKPAVQLFLDSYRFYTDFSEIVKRAGKFIKVDSNNIEDIFCVEESFLNSGILAQELNGENRHMEDVSLHIGFWLWNMYKQCPSLDNRKGKANEGAIYEDFFGFLKENISERMAIITTNYDLVCEYYMNKKEVKLSYPIPDSKFKDVRLRGKENFYIESNTTFDSVPLCKLHGSVNYFENNGSFYVNRELAEGRGNVGGSPIPDRWPLMFALDALSEVRTKLYPLKNFEIGVVPPTYAKLDKKEWLKYTWNGAFELIRKAKKIVFVGYSFPASDGFMKAMFQAALSLKEQSDELEIFVVDKNKDIFKRMQEDYFVNNKSIKYFEGAFTDVWKKSALKKDIERF